MNTKMAKPDEITILRGDDGSPEFVVLRWSAYRDLRARAGDRISAEAPQLSEPAAKWDAETLAGSEDAADIAAAEVGDEAWRREKAAIARAADRVGAEITVGVPHEVVKREFEGVTPVRAWREYRGYNQAQLAAFAGISRSYLAQIETGERTGTADVMARLARNLGCLIEDLLPDAEALTPPP